MKYGSRHETEVSGRLHCPAVVVLGMSPGYTENSRMGGVQRKSGRSVEEKNLLILQESNLKSLAFIPQLGHYID